MIYAMENLPRENERRRKFANATKLKLNLFYQSNYRAEMLVVRGSDGSGNNKLTTKLTRTLIFEGEFGL